MVIIGLEQIVLAMYVTRHVKLVVEQELLIVLHVKMTGNFFQMVAVFSVIPLVNLVPELITISVYHVLLEIMVQIISVFVTIVMVVVQHAMVQIQINVRHVLIISVTLHRNINVFGVIVIRLVILVLVRFIYKKIKIHKL